MRKPFYYLWGGLSKEFRLKAIPDMMRDAKEGAKASRTKPISEETTLDRREFERRYKHLQASCMVLLFLASVSLAVAVVTPLPLSALGAVLAAVVMVMVALTHSFRLSVARHVYRKGGTKLTGVVTMKQYLNLALKKPRELLPLPLPEPGRASDRARKPNQRGL